MNEAPSLSKNFLPINEMPAMSKNFFRARACFAIALQLYHRFSTTPNTVSASAYLKEWVQSCVVATVRAVALLSYRVDSLVNSLSCGKFILVST
jgi:hypothetical protein